jgi:serine/threonine protein kinase
LLGPEPQRTVKVTDFGEGRKVAHGTRMSGLIRGTPSFIAPEVGRRTGDYHTPADVWSFGCLLVSMATRAPNGPYNPERLMRGVGGTKSIDLLISSVAAGTLHPTSNLQRCDWPPAVRRVAEMCVAADPLDRPDFEQIARDLACSARISSMRESEMRSRSNTGELGSRSRSNTAEMGLRSRSNTGEVGFTLEPHSESEHEHEQSVDTV